MPNMNMPRSALKSDYLALIEQLPETDSIQMFGLPVNINRQVQESTCRSVLQQQTLLVGGEAAVPVLSHEYFHSPIAYQRQARQRIIGEDEQKVGSDFG